jgi:hypothetical protein
MLKRFNKIWEVQDSEEVERQRFVQRINQTAFVDIEKMTHPSYESILERVCYELGVNYSDHYRKYNHGPSYGRSSTPDLRSLTRDDFLETLRMLTIIYPLLEESQDYYGRYPRRDLSISINEALDRTTIDLGIRWAKGMFYQSNAKSLDTPLIEDPFDWLDLFPAEKTDFIKAVHNYLSKQYGEVITNCYLTIEGLSRKILRNKKTLENNREELLKQIGLSQQWKSLLSNYLNLANDFQRHASDNRHTLNPLEVEAFLYQTGLLVRLLIESTQATAKTKL